MDAGLLFRLLDGRYRDLREQIREVNRQPDPSPA